MPAAPPPHPLSPLLALAGPAALIAVALAAAASQGRAFDGAVLRALRVGGDLARPIGPAWVESAAVNLTALGSWAVLTFAALLAVGYLAVVRKHAAALFVAVATAGGAGLSALLKDAFGRERPAVVPHLVEVQSLSFPSGHALGATATWLTLGVLLARMEAQPAVKRYLVGAAAAIVAVVGATRVYLGVHWPTDVVAGWAIGGLWAALCWRVAIALQRRGEIER